MKGDSLITINLRRLGRSGTHIMPRRGGIKAFLRSFLASTLILTAYQVASATFQSQTSPGYRYELSGSGTTIWLNGDPEFPQLSNPYTWILGPGFVHKGQTFYYHQDALDRLPLGLNPFSTPIGVDLRGSVGFRLVWDGGPNQSPAPTRQFYRYSFDAMARGSEIRDVGSLFAGPPIPWEEPEYRRFLLGLAGFGQLAPDGPGAFTLGPTPIYATAQSNYPFNTYLPTEGAVRWRYDILNNPFFSHSASNYRKEAGARVSNERTGDGDLRLDLVAEAQNYFAVQGGNILWNTTYFYNVAQTAHSSPEFQFSTPPGFVSFPHIFQDRWYQQSNGRTSKNSELPHNLQALNISSQIDCRVGDATDLAGTAMPTYLTINWHLPRENIQEVRRVGPFWYRNYNLAAEPPGYTFYGASILVDTEYYRKPWYVPTPEQWGDILLETFGELAERSFTGVLLSLLGNLWGLLTTPITGSHGVSFDNALTNPLSTFDVPGLPPSQYRMYPTHWIEHQYQTWTCDSYCSNGYNGVGYFSTMNPIGNRFAGAFFKHYEEGAGGG